MNFEQSISTCLKKYGTFSGRATRSEYWWFFLLNCLNDLGFMLLYSPEAIMRYIVSFILLVPFLAAGSK